MDTRSVPISVQLYSLRDAAAIDFESVLRRLGEAGFVGVELAGFHGLSPARFAEIAGEAGLVVSSGHVGATTPDELDAALDELDAVGCSAAILPFLPPAAFADTDAIGRSAEVINTNARRARERGFSYGYHNHFWEFAVLPDGRTAWSHLVERLDPDVVIELDAYWAQVGGVDPAAAVTELGDRLRFLHVKDGPADDPAAAMVAVGTGAVDIAGVLTAASAVEWHVVELDRCDTDMFEAVEDSYRFLVGNGWSQGRR